MAAEPSSHLASSSKRVSQLIDGLKQGESSARWRAVKALSGIGSDAESAIPVLVDALRDKTIIVRVGAAEALGRLGSRATSAVPKLIECLHDKYATVRETAAAALGAIGPGACAAIDVLWPLLIDENKYVRAEVERALVQVCSDRSVNSLELLCCQLNHDDSRVKAAIARVLGAIGSSDPKILGGLESLLADADSQVRVSAAEAIVNLAPESRTPIPVLIRALDDSDPEIRSGAATVLEQLDPSELRKRTSDPQTRLGASNEIASSQELPANLAPRDCRSAGYALPPTLPVSSSERLWRIPSLLHLGTLELRVLHERLIRLWVPVPCALSTGSDSISVRPSRLARGAHEVVLTVESHQRTGRFEERLSLRSPSQTRSTIIQYEIVEGSRQEPRSPSARAVVWQPMDWNQIVYDTRMKDLARLREKSSLWDQTGLYGTPRALIEDGSAAHSPGQTPPRRRKSDHSVENSILETVGDPAELLTDRQARSRGPRPASLVPLESRRGESSAPRRVTRSIRLKRVLPVTLLGLLILIGATLLWPGKSFLDADPSRPTTKIREWPVPPVSVKPTASATSRDISPASATIPNAGKEAGPEVTKTEAARTVEEVKVPSDGPQPVMNSVGMRLVLVPPRRFLMGSDDGAEPGASPAHLVELTRPILVGQFEVTQGEWTRVMGSKSGAWFSAERLMVPKTMADSLPVDSVSWFDAVRFCNRLSEREQLPPYYSIAGEVTIPDRAEPGYRLPTESEWESFCRETTTTRWFFGDRPSDLEAYAIFAVNSHEQTHPVGLKRANSYGLYDLYGNVAEWCWDWMGEYSKEPIVDPTGPAKGRYRILRGGAWDTYESDISSANRSSMLPEKPNRSNGFRVVRNLLEPGKK
ncbi:MAG: SUMF1/EgtB/PvdO family nonheme iron enzyme [Planctomycetaceae bacterium]|nr:SUMF1/EgtB/PvdO family nonheme iron enzyme [Planctomycetaceae bacterium]